MSDKNSSESAVLGWKFVLIVGVLSAIFLGFFYLAMSNEPDYMPGAQRKAQQHEMQQKLKNRQINKVSMTTCLKWTCKNISIHISNQIFFK